ncbi:hypothetical protein [Patiriisocius marinus]|uniref:hypothetical protein n=1 Tax=Patiriisocius marinus TaxID=1397112 RepID=UPI00232F4350|nr:hypothetical protein [Patiriisocius marinus]
MHTDDILQLDDLIEHANYHNEQYGDSLIVFISKHYGELKADHDKDHEEEQEEHEQLPFQHQSCSSAFTGIILNTTKEEFRNLEFIELKKHNFYYQSPSSSLHLEGLFQPPRHS